MDVTLPADCIVVGVDGTDHSYATVKWAIELGQAVRRPVTVVNVYRHDLALAEYAWAGDYTIDDARAGGEAIVRDAIAPFLHTGIVTGRAINGDGWRPLVAASADAWLLVVGAHPHSLRQGLVGSFAQKVLAHARCAAVVVPTVTAAAAVPERMPVPAQLPLGDGEPAQSV